MGRFKVRSPRALAVDSVCTGSVSGTNSSTRTMNGNNGYALRDTCLFNTYNYGDVGYWDNRYLQEVGPFDWYQRYSELRPYINTHIPKASRILVVGCGNAVMSEDMVIDGYREIVNIDISSVAIGMMQKKYEHIPQLKYVHMDARDMSCFSNELFDSVIDKGTLDSLMCGASAPLSAASMLEEVSRVLKPEGVYMLITYGDPRLRVPHLNLPHYNWTVTLYIIPRPGFETPGLSSAKSLLEPVPLTEDGMLPPNFVLEDPDSHYIYVCKKLMKIDF